MRLKLVAAVLAVVLLPFGSAVADEEVPLANAGFERLSPDGAVTDWGMDVAQSSAGSAIVASTDAVHGGVGSLELVVRGHGTVTAESAPVALEVGRLYRLSAWIRTDGAVSDPMTKYPTAVPACLTMASFPFTNHTEAVGGDSDWTRVESLFFATRSEDRVRLHLGRNGNARGAAWFDDVRLERVDDITEYIPLETVRWSGNGFRYEDRGWIVVHIEGEPYRPGPPVRLLVADEIVSYIFKLGVLANEADPEAGWRRLRFECDTLFLRSYDEEYLREMKGIADGAADAGGEAWGRPLDLVDIVTINSVVDLGQLEDAIEITPHALTGEAFIAPDEELEIAPEKHSCSAFAATGPATSDRRHRLRPDLHVGRLHRGALERHHRCRAHRRPPARLPHLPRGDSLRGRFLPQLGGDHHRRDHGVADAVGARLDAAVQPDPQGGAVRFVHRRRRAHSVGRQQRDVHQRLAHRRHQDRRGGHPPARHPLQEAVADRRGHGAFRYTGISLGQQQQPRSRGAQGVPRPARRPALRSHVLAVEPRHRVQRVLRRALRAPSTPRPGSSSGPHRRSTAPTPATARSRPPRWPRRWSSWPTTAR